MKRNIPILAPLAVAALLAACATPPAGTEARTASIQRTTNGVAHITAPDTETLAYGVAYAHAQDNVCQTAQQLVTARGQRSRWFGGLLPTTAFAIVAQTGNMYNGLWYPITIALITLVIGVLFVKETKDVDIYARD